MVGEVNGESVETVGDRGAGRAACPVIRSEHEVIDHQLRSALKELVQCHAAVVGVESIVAFDAHPRQRLALLG